MVTAPATAADATATALVLQLRFRDDHKIPRGSIYTTIMELGPKRPSPLWFWGPNSRIVVYMDPLGS